MNQAKRLLEPKRVINIVPIFNPSFSEGGGYEGQGMVTFSYDDGFRNNYTIALPLHQKYNIPLTLNIVPSFFTSTPRFMSKFEVKDADKRGAEIASHSFSHENLTNKTDEELHFEFGESQKELLKLVDRVETFAVPYSQYNDDIKEIGGQYYSAIRVHSDRQNTIPPEDRHWLYSRIAVRNTTTFEQVKDKIDQAAQDRQWCIIMLHGIDEEKQGEYEITPQLLEEMLAYVASFNKSELMAVNTRDGIKFATGEE